MHDARIGRFWSIDPLFKDYPHWTPYQFAGLTPIQAKELEGLEPKYMTSTSTPAVPEIGLVANDAIPNLSLNMELINLDMSPKKEKFQIPESYDQGVIKPTYSMESFLETAQTVHPVSYGGNGFGVGLARDPVFQASTVGVLTGGIGSSVNMTGGFLFKGSVSAATDFGVQYAVNSGDLNKIDYFDIGVSFSLNNPGYGTMFSNSMGSTLGDLYVTGGDINFQSPLLGNKDLDDSLLELGTRTFFGGVGTSFNNNLGGYFSNTFNYSLKTSLNLTNSCLLNDYSSSDDEN